MTSLSRRTADRAALVGLVCGITLLMAFGVVPIPTAVAGGSLGTPGEIVDLADISAHPDSRPRGVSRAYAVKYLSPGASGELVPVAGTVLVPEGPAPAGGWRMLAFNHGTAGLGPDCATSAGLGGDHGYHEWLAPWINRDFVIVGTEYAGIGTDGRHSYLDSRMTGANVLDMVRAGRTLLEDLGEPLADDLVVSGGSQGAHASLSAAAYAGSYAPELDFTAVVASAPPVRIVDYLSLLGPTTPLLPVPDYVTYLSYILAGLEYSEPDLDVSKYLTPLGRKIVDAAKTVCYKDQNETSRGVSVGAVLARPLADGDLISVVRERLSVPERGFEAPILVQQGVFDPTAFAVLTSAFVDSVRGSGAWVDYRQYLKTHSLGSTSQVDAAVWIDQHLS